MSERERRKKEQAIKGRTSNRERNKEIDRRTKRERGKNKAIERERGTTQ